MRVSGATVDLNSKDFVDPFGRKITTPGSCHSVKSSSTGASHYRHIYGTSFRNACYKTKDGRFYMITPQGTKQFINRQDYDRALQEQKRGYTQDTNNFKYYYDEGNGKYFYADEKEQKHYITREEFQRLTAHTHKYRYTTVAASAKHYYASTDGRYFFLDDEGHKFYVDKATYDRAKGQQELVTTRRYYHQEGSRFYYIDSTGAKKYVTKAEFDQAAASGTKHALVPTSTRTYYSTSDGKYFYIDQSGQKQFVSQQEYQSSTQGGSPTKNLGQATTSSKQFKTQYDTNFSNKRNTSPQQKFRAEDEILPSKVPMDLGTINRLDFQPWAVEGPPEATEAVQLTQTLPFVSRTTHAADYPDWGPAKVEKISHVKPPLDTKDIQFDARTTYGQSFIPGTGGPTQPMAKWGPSNPIQGAEVVPIQSLNQADFAAPTYNLESSSGFKQEAIPNLMTSPGHFQSTNRNDFAGQIPAKGEYISPEMDPYGRTALYVSPRNHKGQFKSTTEKDFSQKRPELLTKIKPEGELLPSKVPMDMQTTNRNDFIAFEVEDPVKATEFQPWEVEAPMAVTESAGQSLPFVSRSTHAADYPDWGPAKVEKISHQKPPLDTKDIQFDARTTYGESFIPGTGSPTQPLAKWAASNPIQGAETVPIQSLKQQDFSPPKYNLQNAPGFKEEAIPNLRTSPGHFQSTNRNDFAGLIPAKGEQISPEMDPYGRTALYMSPRNHKGQFTSIHEKDFSKKRPEPVTLVKAEDELLPSKVPMNMQTTSRNDFIPFAVEGPYMPTEAPPAAPQIPFSGRTTQKADFPHWGPYHAVPAKPNNLPYRGGEVPFEHQSTYADQYAHKPEGKPAEAIPFDREPKSPIKHGEDLPMVSTKQSDFIAPGYGFVFEEAAAGDQAGNPAGFAHAKGNYNGNGLAFSGPNVYRTEHQTNYKGDQVVTDAGPYEGGSQVAYEVEVPQAEVAKGPYVHEIRDNREGVYQHRCRTPEGNRIGVKAQSGAERYAVHEKKLSQGIRHEKMSSLGIEIKSATQPIQSTRRLPAKLQNNGCNTHKAAMSSDGLDIESAKSLIKTYFSSSAKNLIGGRHLKEKLIGTSSTPKIAAKYPIDNAKGFKTRSSSHKEAPAYKPRYPTEELAQLEGKRPSSRPRHEYKASPKLFKTEYRSTYSRGSSRRK